MRSRYLPLIAAIAFALPATVDAKGTTYRITITTTDNKPVADVSNDKVTAFNVWSGAGVRINGEPQMEGFIAQWGKGPVTERPAGLQRYRVSFYTGCRMDELYCRSPELRLSYYVLYEYDPAANEGYVYIPATSDEGYKGQGMARPGFDGKWYLATPAWRDFAAPLVSAATTVSVKLSTPED